MIKQLNPSIPLMTPKGRGECWLVIDYGPESDVLFVVCDDKTGQVWTWPNSQIRGLKNISLLRDNPERLDIPT